jgi:hypothetical protein
MKSHWDEYQNYLSREIIEIYDRTRNLLLLDPVDCIAPYFSHDPPRSNKDLRRLPLIRRGHPQNFQGALLNAAGLKPEEVRKSEIPLGLKGSLSDIDARTLYNGPFRLSLTNDPSLHLRFAVSDPRKQPSILVLDSRTMCNLALLDLTGFME